jgi:DNA invertase Pin-like site-specific DNA recombinase
MNDEPKITPEHLRRRAVIYLHQSSEGQVRNNLESQQLQYALAHRATGLGFDDVEILDVDLGLSAAMAAKRREGFERLLGAVALGEVGLILSRELSRLVRTDRDFCQLVELCQLFDTLLGDEHTIYDVSRMDDQLVLGIKATLSVVELKVLRMRLLEGKEHKAKRGALYPRLPPGYVWDAMRQVAKDPNLRVQEAMQLIFAKFRETWSMRQTFKWFRDNDVEVPVTQARGGTLVVVFQPPRLTFIADVLTIGTIKALSPTLRRFTEPPLMRQQPPHSEGAGGRRHAIQRVDVVLDEDRDAMERTTWPRAAPLRPRCRACRDSPRSPTGASARRD